MYFGRIFMRLPLPWFSLYAVGFQGAVPNSLSVACVLVSLFVFVLNNVCGWKKGNDLHFFQSGYSTFITTCINYSISKVQVIASLGHM